MAKINLTAARLRELLHYDPETGVFTRKQAGGRGQKVGSIAGSTSNLGYVPIRVNNGRYFAHRLAWLYVTGDWPSHHIDHIDGNPSNNSFSNLRDVSTSGNTSNRHSCQTNSKSGLLGVTFHKNCWRATIVVNRKQIHIGHFETAELAHAAYLAKKRELHPTCMI